MATAADVRAWAKDNGRGTTRGKLPGVLVADWDAAHPGDPYEAGPPRGEVNGHAPDYPDDDFDKLFPEVDTGEGAAGDTGEVPPRKIPARRKTSGGWNPFGKKKTTGHKKKTPRVSTEGLISAVWRGAAAMVTPLPPLQRTLRMQAPVAGMMLDDTVKDTFIDPLLQPLCRMMEQGKTVQALAGPPFFVTAIMSHQAQRAAMDPPQEPHPLFMMLAMQGLRSSLAAWAEVAGPKFELAMQAEQEFMERHGATIDGMIAMIFAPPVDPNDVEAVMAEEDAIRRAQGVL